VAQWQATYTQSTHKFQVEREPLNSSMSISTLLILLLIGLFIGTISGMIGIGGGVLVIPVLMIGFGFSQVRANGTSIAMLLPPIGIFAVFAYARSGNVDWRFALILAIGFAVGAYFGARIVNRGLIDPTVLRVLFALLLVYVAARMLFRPGGRARAALETVLLVAGFAVAYGVMRLLGRRWGRQPPDWVREYRRRRREAGEFDYEI
jgi:uncharacterized membrane protein YfcA